MNVTCGAKGVVDIDRPNQGITDISRAGFKNLFLDFSAYVPAGELENIGKAEAKNTNRYPVIGNPEQLERLQTKGKAAAEAGFSHGKYEGDELQLPAVWVVEADGTLSYVKYGEAVADIPTPDELIAML